MLLPLVCFYVQVKLAILLCFRWTTSKRLFTLAGGGQNFIMSLTKVYNGICMQGSYCPLCTRCENNLRMEESLGEQLNDLYTPILNTGLKPLLVNSKWPGDLSLVTGDARLCVCTLYILLTMQINNRNCGQITFLYLKDVLFWMEKINWLFLCPF